MNIETFLKQNDLPFFLAKTSLRAAANEMKKAGSSESIKHLMAELKEERQRQCQFWGVRTNPTLRGTDATPEYWDKLKIVVSQHMLLLQGRKADDACKIVRRYMATNVRLMNGLPERLRVWKAKKGV